MDSCFLKIRNYPTKIIALITFLLINTNINAQTKTFSGTGNWNDAARWSPSGTPASTDLVIISAGSSVTVNGDFTCDSMVFSSNSTSSTVTISGTNHLTVTRGIRFTNPSAGSISQTIAVGAGRLTTAIVTMNGSNNSGRTNNITVSTGLVTISTDLSMADGTANDNRFEFTGAGTLRLGGTWSNLANAANFINGTGTVEYTSSSAQSIRARTYNKLRLSGGTKTPAGNIVVNDTFDIVSGATLDNSGTANLTMNGVFYIQGTYTEGSTSGNVTLVGLVHVTSTGTFNATVGESFVIRGGILNNGTFNSGTGGFTFATNNQTLSGTRAIVFLGNVTVTGITLTNEDSVQINGNFTGTGAFDNLSLSYLRLNGGTTSITTLTATASNNTVHYGRTSATQTLIATTYHNLRITSGSTKSLAAATTVNGDLFVESGTTFNLTTFTLNMGGSSTNSGTGIIQTTSTGTPYTAGRTWASTVRFNVNAGQNVPQGTYAYLDLRGGGSKVATGAITINGTLDIASGTTFSMSTFRLINGGTFTTVNTGTLSTGCTTFSPTPPFPTGITYTFNSIVYNSASAQEVVNGTYISLNISGGPRTFSSAGNINITGIFTAGSGPFTVTGSLVNFSLVGSQNIPACTFNNLTLSGGATKTATGNITVNGTLNIQASTTLNLSTFQLLGSLTNSGPSTGTIFTEFATAATPPIPNGVTWSSTVNYRANSSNQAISGGSYASLTISRTNTTAYTKTALGNISCAATLNVATGLTLAMSTFALSGDFSTTGTGVLTTTHNSTVSPITADRTFTFGVEYNANSGTQTIVPGTYTTLTCNNGATRNFAAGNINLSSTLTPGTSTFTASVGSTVTFTSSGTQTIPAITFHNLSSTGTGSRTLASGTVNVAGNFSAGTNTYTVTGNTMNFNGVDQNISGIPGGYNNLATAGSGTKTATQNLVINGTLTTAVNTTLNLTAAFTLSGTLTTVTNNGTIRTGVPTTLSSTPIPTGRTWAGTIEYNGSGAQTFVAGTYNNVIINNSATGGVSLSSSPTINGTLTFTNGRLFIGANTLTLAGSIVNTVTGGLSGGSTSNLTINGNVSRTLSFNQTTPGTTNVLDNLVNNSSSGTTTIGNTLRIITEVTPTSGSINASGNLVLVSTSSRTARIGTGTGSYITGNIIAQRFVPSISRRWRFLSSPVNGATIEDWRGEIFITGPGTGTTVGTTNSNGYDATQSNAAGIFSYDETATGDLNAGWTIPSTTSTALQTGRGYRVFVRGDRSDINRLNNTNMTQNSVTMDVIQTPNIGAISMPVFYTNNSTAENVGWNLVGNPYPSSYDWNAFHDLGRSGNSGTYYTNIEPTIWVLDPNDNSYKFYNALSNSGTITGGIIAQGQAFFVKATGASPAMTFREEYKVATNPTPLLKTNEEGAFSIRMVRDSINADELLVKYMSASTTNFDAYDVRKLASPVSIAAWDNDSIFLSLSVRPLNQQNDTIRLSVNGNVSGNYQLLFANSTAIDVQDQVFLVDRFTNTVTDLKNTSTYSFSIANNNPATFGLNRFFIVVASNQAVPVKLISFGARKKADKQVELHWATAIERNASHFEIEHAGSDLVFHKVGRLKAKGNSDIISQYSYLHTGENVNYYRLKQVDWNGDIMYSDIIKVDFTTDDLVIEQPLQIYPIPAEREVNVKLNSTHNIVLITVNKITGELVYEKELQTKSHRLITENWEAGTYVITVMDESGFILREKIIKQ